jgi:hypothetical protein
MLRVSYFVPGCYPMLFSELFHIVIDGDKHGLVLHGRHTDNFIRRLVRQNVSMK